MAVMRINPWVPCVAVMRIKPWVQCGCDGDQAVVNVVVVVVHVER